MLEPLELKIGNEYNLNNVKEISVTKDFLALDKTIINCQNEESLEDCKTRKYFNSMLELCRCLPFAFKTDFENLCSTVDQLKCVQNLKVDFSECSVKCEGMDIISYDQFEINSKIARLISKLNKRFYDKEFDKNPALTRYISKLSRQYTNYKDTYNFPTIYQGKSYF